METITEDYVSFETAKLLKEKGFDKETRKYYPIKGDATNKLMDGSEYPHNNSQVQICAPTLQMAMKWLREVHNKNIILDMISLDKESYVLWTFNVYCNRNYKIMWGTKQPKYNTYEDACEAAINYCLENLI